MTTLRERVARELEGTFGCTESEAGAWADTAIAAVRAHLSEQGRRMPPAIEDILADAQLGRRCGCSGCDDAAATAIDDAWQAMLAAAFEDRP